MHFRGLKWLGENSWSEMRMVLLLHFLTVQWLLENIRIIDVQQPCVHWNGHKIVFAGIENRDSNWRIYEINKAGTRINKITFTDRNIDLSQFGNAAYRFTRYDDIDPIYLPDGKIIFASTRFPSLSIFGGANTTNLYITDTLTLNFTELLLKETVVKNQP